MGEELTDRRLDPPSRPAARRARATRPGRATAQSVAVNGFVIDAIRKAVSGVTCCSPPSSQTPSAANTVSPSYRRPTASPGTLQRSRASAAHSASCFAETRSTRGLLPYCETAASAVRVPWRAGRRPRRRISRRKSVPLTKEAKQEIIGQHGRSEADTGSPQVQIALLTRRVNELTEHLRAHRRTTIRDAVCSSWSAAAGGSCSTCKSATSRGIAH